MGYRSRFQGSRCCKNDDMYAISGSAPISVDDDHEHRQAEFGFETFMTDDSAFGHGGYHQSPIQVCIPTLVPLPSILFENPINLLVCIILYAVDKHITNYR